MQLTRRSFLKTSAAAIGATGALGVYAWRIEPHWVDVVHRPLSIANLPPALAGKTIVQLSDIHMGPIVDKNYLQDAIQGVAQMKPDLVVLTGDLMTYDHADQQAEATRLVEPLLAAPLGCVAIMGNHDYGWQWREIGVADLLERKLTQAGVCVLRNASRQFAGLNIIGLDDFWSPCFRPREVLSKIDSSQANLVLCHNPDGADQPVWSNYKGWILAGHTHGGQVKPPFLPPPMLPVFNRRYTSGAIEVYDREGHPDGRWLYINRGLGYSRRVRFNVRPEITVFQLTATA